MLLCPLPAQILSWVITRYDHTVVDSRMTALSLARGAGLSFPVSKWLKILSFMPGAVPNAPGHPTVVHLCLVLLCLLPAQIPYIHGSQIWYCCSLGLAWQNLKTLIWDFSTLRRARKFSGPAFESYEFTLSSGGLFSLTLLQSPDPCQYLHCHDIVLRGGHTAKRV